MITFCLPLDPLKKINYINYIYIYTHTQEKSNLEIEKNQLLTRSNITSDFLKPNTEAKYLMSSVFASPCTGGADIATPTASSEISVIHN